MRFTHRPATSTSSPGARTSAGHNMWGLSHRGPSLLAPSRVSGSVLFSAWRSRCRARRRRVFARSSPVLSASSCVRRACSSAMSASSRAWRLSNRSWQVGGKLAVEVSDLVRGSRIEGGLMTSCVVLLSYGRGSASSPPSLGAPDRRQQMKIRSSAQAIASINLLLSNPGNIWRR
jgi:hypothetical protein